MVTFSLITAFVTAFIVSLFSGFPGIWPVLLFLVLLLINCECMAANVCEDDKTSTLFMAVISSSLAVMLCGTVVSSTLSGLLTDAGLLDPDKIHPVIPLLVFVFVAGIYLLFRRRADAGKLAVQKLGSSLMKRVDKRTYNPNLKRLRKVMIKEKILTERLPEDDA